MKLSFITRFSSLSLWSLVWLIRFGQRPINAQTTLQPEELYTGIQSGLYPVLIDTRRTDEWNAGHLENATFVENFSEAGVPLPQEILDCDTCRIVVYCRSGARAGAAIQRMISEYGMDASRLYNGLGVSRWIEAGYPLVTTDSTDPMCSQRNEQCQLANSTMAPTTDLPLIDSSLFLPTLEVTSEHSSTLFPTTSSFTPLPVLSLNAQELYDGMQQDQFDMVLDVRNIMEFKQGHIPNVTLMENLAVDGVIPSLLLDNNATCRYTACHIAVTCRTGERAGVAISRLQEEFGFVNTVFYNGGGVSQWQEAGYDLVTTLESIMPKCAETNSATTDILQELGDSISLDEDGNCISCCLFFEEEDDDILLNETDIIVDEDNEPDIINDEENEPDIVTDEENELDDEETEESSDGSMNAGADTGGSDAATVTFSSSSHGILMFYLSFVIGFLILQ